MTATTNRKYTINTECGLMRNIEAASIDEAKEIYAAKMDYDFDGAVAGDYPGSWYFVADAADGERLEDFTAEMP